MVEYIADRGCIKVQELAFTSGFATMDSLAIFKCIV